MNITPTGVNRQTYLDIMERAFNAYPVERLLQRRQIDGKRMDLQGYSRLTCVLSCLLSAGRMQSWRDIWQQMMTECCEELPTIRQDIIADFAAKEIMMAYKMMKVHVPESLRQQWLASLKRVDPYVNYGKVIRREADRPRIHNINIYNMVGEFLRETEGLTDTTDYFKQHWPEQIKRFDGNGMYKDPGCPVLYDLTTRCQIQLLLGFGYAGDYAEKLDALLKKAGQCTLLMQSAAFEGPYGGRSNQFLFNEALIAANCEYEASRYMNEGDLRMAGAFKRSARLAIRSIERWLQQEPPRHIKNFYPIENAHGIENYGHYDKYMITLAAFLIIGYVFADDAIEEQPCPAETGGYIWQSSDDFHKVFASAKGYSLQLDWKADPKYDAIGLGRLHRRGVPTELALSIPLTAGEGYAVSEGLARISATIGPAWRDKHGKTHTMATLDSSDLRFQLTILKEDPSGVAFEAKYTAESNIPGCEGIVEKYQLDANGLDYEVSLIQPDGADAFRIEIPLLLSNGKDQTSIALEEHVISVELEGSLYRIESEGQLYRDNTAYANRNGVYDIVSIHFTENRGRIKLSLE